MKASRTVGKRTLTLTTHCKSSLFQTFTPSRGTSILWYLALSPLETPRDSWIPPDPHLGPQEPGEVLYNTPPVPRGYFYSDVATSRMKVSYDRAQEGNSTALGVWLISTVCAGARQLVSLREKERGTPAKIYNYRELAGGKQGPGAQRSQSVGAGGVGGGGGAFWAPQWKLFTDSPLSHPGRTSPQHKSQEKLQGVAQATQRKDDSPRKSNVMTRVQKAKTERAQTAGPEGKAGDRICHLNAQGGRVSHRAGTALGGCGKVTVEGGRSVEKGGEGCVTRGNKDLLHPRRFCAETAPSTRHSWPQLWP